VVVAFRVDADAVGGEFFEKRVEVFDQVVDHEGRVIVFGALREDAPDGEVLRVGFVRRAPVKQVSFGAAGEAEFFSVPGAERVGAG